MLKSFRIPEGKYVGLPWTIPENQKNSSPLYSGTGELTLTELETMKPQQRPSKIKITLRGSLNMTGLKSEELRIFTSAGDAVGIRTISSLKNFFSEEVLPSNGGPDFIINVPPQKLAEDGPPIIMVVFYDRFVEKDVSQLMRGLEGGHQISDPQSHTAEIVLGTLAEIHQPENIPMKERPTLIVDIQVEGFPASVWTKRQKLEVAAGPKDQGASSRVGPDSLMNYQEIKRRWNQQTEFLRGKYPGITPLDPAFERIYLGSMTCGGTLTGFSVPFGPGFVAESRNHVIDADTLMTIFTIGKLLAFGTSGFSSNLAHVKTEMPSEEYRVAIQAGASLVTTLVSYLNDSSVGLRVKTPKIVRVERPTFALESGCLDCEDGSGFISSFILALKQFEDFEGGSGGPDILPLDVNLPNGVKNVSRSSALKLCKKAAEKLKGLEFYLALVDLHNPSVVTLDGHGSSEPHATGCLLPKWPSPSERNKNAIDISKEAMSLDTDPELTGCLLDSINPITEGTSVKWFQGVKKVEQSIDWLDSATSGVWSDTRVAAPADRDSRYARLVHVLRLFSTEGGEYTVISSKGSTKRLGCVLNDLVESLAEPFKPLLTKEEMKLSEDLGALEYPRQPLILTGRASVTLVFTEPVGEAMPSTPPTGRIHFVSFDFSRTSKLRESLKAGDLTGRVVCGLRIELPGIINPGLVVLEWSE